MGNFSTNESCVRVDIFKASGKWYSTFAIDMAGYYKEPSLKEALAKALYEQTRYKEDEEGDLFAVCLDPYHENSHPIMIKVI